MQKNKLYCVGTGCFIAKCQIAVVGLLNKNVNCFGVYGHDKYSTMLHLVHQ